MKAKLLKILTLMLCISLALFIASCGGEKDKNKKPSKESEAESSSESDLEASQGLEYKLNLGGKSYSVVGIGSCTDTDVVIPGFYEDLPVTSIGEEAFDGCYSLTGVTFKDTSTWHVTENSDYTGGSSIDVTGAKQNATYLTSTYYNYYWYKG